MQKKFRFPRMKLTKENATVWQDEFKRLNEHLIAMLSLPLNEYFVSLQK